MLTEGIHRNRDEVVTVAALAGSKPGAPFIAPWWFEANQDHLHEGLEQCGCAFCPDDEGQHTT